ncbi:PREDICTED: uncharacterized protein LOC109218540 [Nicotiana attenuata]|uniref:uncharacterized protein LOC109218540 n=1 Tax=Nicotiana attenuata TaxID=49451 RepID=UPI000904AB90|nr:PREDICTED: uncharacterized protein LOC109218540 [Nicotiana attenuata]
MVTVRAVLSFAAMNGDLMEEVYMTPPPGLLGEGEPPRICFLQSRHDYSLFSKRSGSDLVIIVIYVYDLLITGSSSQLIQEAKTMLQHHFKIKDLGKMRYFLGLEIARSRHGILTNSHGNLNVDELLSDPNSYQRIVGKLLYLAMTSPDINYDVQNLRQFMHKLKRSYLEGALKVVRYLKNASGLGILLSSKPSKQLTVHCDADWATCPMTRKLVSGFVVKLGDSLISYKSKKQVQRQGALQKQSTGVWLMQ